MDKSGFAHRFVQTFWTINHSMLTNNFGWINPEYHLMSWTLSAYSLIENADELVLYTDSEGARILVDTLHLPYTELIVCYDNLDCPSAHWAIPKILTYHKQDKPFVHVDGDLYLPSGLSAENWEVPLLTQNQESGTPYYKQMMNFVLRQNPQFPDYLMKELAKEQIGSYNAGVMGGTDIDFIQFYCNEALKVINNNGWMHRGCPTANVNQNLLFEQLLFYALVKKEGKKVHTLTDKVIGDNQYTFGRTCNFFRYDSVPFIHLLGSYKRNTHVCGLMQKTLLSRYPNAYEQILKLFIDKHPRLSRYNKRNVIPQMNVANSISHYEQYVNQCLTKWETLSNEELMQAERIAAHTPFVFNVFLQEEAQISITRAPFTVIYNYPQSFPKKGFEMLTAKISKKEYNNYSDIAIRPTLTEKGYDEQLINDFQYNLLILLKTPMTFDNLRCQIEPTMKQIANTQYTIDKLLKRELQQLVFKGLVVIDKIHSSKNLSL